jgi:hypothetical protein
MRSAIIIPTISSVPARGQPWPQRSGAGCGVVQRTRLVASFWPGPLPADNG